jgi:hypothetical protein
MASMKLPLTQNERTKIVKTFVKNAVAGLVLSALILVVISAPVRAQVLAHSGEVAGTVGSDYTSMTSVDPASDILPTSQYFLSGSSGFNVTPYITALAEYKYDPLVAVSGSPDKWHSQLSGAAARFNFMPSKKVVPYAIVGVGYYRLTVSFSGITQVADGYYVNGGGGASIYFGPHWGIRPEIRYERQHATYGSQIITSNVADESVSIFYQFGGTGKKKK